VKGKLFWVILKGICGSVYLVIVVCLGNSFCYELRIFFKKYKYEFCCVFVGGGGGFLKIGKSWVIKGVNKLNVLCLKVVGNKVIVRVNFRKVVEVIDLNVG